MGSNLVFPSEEASQTALAAQVVAGKENEPTWRQIWGQGKLHNIPAHSWDVYILYLYL